MIRDMREEHYKLRVETKGFTGLELTELENVIESVSGAGTVQPRTGEPLPDGSLYAPAPSIHITVHLEIAEADVQSATLSKQAALVPYRKLAEQVAAKTSKWVDSRFSGGRREVDTEVQLYGPDKNLIAIKSR